MNAEVKVFYEYICNIFQIEQEANAVIYSFSSIVEETIKNKTVLELDDKTFSELISKKVGKEIDCHNYGINNVNEIVLSSKKRNIIGIYRVKRQILIEKLTKLVRDNTFAKLRELDDKFKQTGIEIPKYVVHFVTDIEDSGDDDLYEEFKTKLSLCEDINSVINLCDEMKKMITLKKLTEKINELSNSVDNLEDRINTLENEIRNNNLNNN